MEVVERYRVGLLLLPPEEANEPEYVDTLAALRRRVSGGWALEAVAGQEVRLGDGVVLRVLNPPGRRLRGTRSDVDNNGVVLRIEYGEVAFLLTADIFSEAEAALLAGNAPLSASVLKVGHHGGDTSSSRDFLNAVSPALAVISVGRENRFDHPDSEVVERLRALVPPERQLLTSTHGGIHLTTDGRRLWLETERTLPRGPSP
jgi:competence protein ComEC